MEVIDSLGAENFALYLVDLETNELEVYRRGEDDTANFALISEQEGDYPVAMERYIDTYVVEEDRARVRAEVGSDALLQCGAASLKEMPISRWATGACSGTRSSTWSCVSSVFRGRAPR